MSYLTGFPDLSGAFVYVNARHVVRVRDLPGKTPNLPQRANGYTSEITTCHGGVETVTIVAGKASYVAKTLNRRLDAEPGIEEETTDA